MTKSHGICISWLPITKLSECSTTIRGKSLHGGRVRRRTSWWRRRPQCAPGRWAPEAVLQSGNRKDSSELLGSIAPNQICSTRFWYIPQRHPRRAKPSPESPIEASPNILSMKLLAWKTGKEDKIYHSIIAVSAGDENRELSWHSIQT
jgi:hypothetical protein